MIGHLLKVRAFFFKVLPLLLCFFELLSSRSATCLRREPLRAGGLQLPPELRVLLRKRLCCSIARLQLPDITDTAFVTRRPFTAGWAAASVP
jgi:hypothetical protein